MRKVALLLAFVLVSMISMVHPVDGKTALRVAQQFWTLKGGQHPEGLVDVSSRLAMDNIFLFEQSSGRGFVAVAADDVALPIMGYSMENGVSEEVNREARYWLGCLNGEIAWALANGLVGDAATAEQWERLLAGDTIPGRYNTAVAPLTTVTWNQGNFYNNLCPADASAQSGGHAYTGCVATAMATVMKKWNHPVSGTGSHSYVHSTYGTLSANFAATTYQWSNMPSSLSSSSSSAQVNAVATLMYHCGVAVEMNYGPTSSGAQTASQGSIADICAENALICNFKYKNTIHAVGREGRNWSDWVSLITADLNAGRPVLYSGRDVSGGHAFVCDGYDNSGNYHFNWGWGGYCDGYYPLNALNPAPGGAGGNATGSYNASQTVLLGIEPRTTEPSTCTLTATCNSSQGTVSGSGNYSFGDTASSLATPVSGYRFDHWSDGSCYNPREIFMTGNQTISAVFLPLNADTLRYDNSLTTMGFGGGDTTRWAVKFEPANFAGHSSVSRVLMYIRTTGYYTIQVCQGGTNAPGTVLATKTQYCNEGDWATFVFNNPVSLTASQNLWIAAKSAASYPIALSCYAGTPNGSYYGNSATSYTPLTSWGYYFSFPIRAVLSNGGGTSSFTITANAQSTTCGSVTGGGQYAAGDTVTLLASANENYRFTQWSDGNTSNPRIFLASGDASYTAQYSNLGTDTLRYDNGTCLGNVGAGGAFYWAVKYPAASLGSHNQLKAVKLWSNSGAAGSVTVRIYQGGANAPSTLKTTQTITLPSTEGWGVYNLTNPVNLTAGQPVWIVLYSTSANYPAPKAEYAGHDNSCYVSFDGSSWNPLYAYGEDFRNSWMIRAVLGNASQTYTITANVQSSTYGSVTGGGQYAAGDTVTLLASANENYRFTQWSDGNTSNPRIFLAAGNASYTAQYANLGSDTLRYDNGSCVGNVGAGGAFYWAVKYPAASLGSHNQLKAVKLWSNSGAAGSVTVRIYQGGANAPSTLETTQTITLPSTEGWGVYNLTNPVNLTAGQPVWIVLYSTSANYPAPKAEYAGHDNSCYVSFDGSSWNPLYAYGEDFRNSWMIRAVLGTAPVNYTVTVNSNNTAWGTVTGGGTYASGTNVTLRATPNSGYHFVSWNDGNTSATRTIVVTGNATYTATFAQDVVNYTITVNSNNTAWGTVTGGGTYASGTNVTLRATPNSGYHFVSWNDGNTSATRTIVVTGNATYTATFAEDSHEGIDEITEDQVVIYPNPTKGIVTVSVPNVQKMELLDQLGRVIIVKTNANTIDLSALAPGTYLLRITTENGVLLRRVARQ